MSATVQEATSSNSTVDAPPPPTTGTRGRKGKRLPKRATISNTSPREWCRPLAPGVVPAYDLAVELLKTDSAQIKSEAELLRTLIQSTEENRSGAAAKQEEGAMGVVHQLDNEVEAMRKKLKILEVQGEVNLPDIRWKVANAMPDMNKTVDRHLLEQKWRKDGDLDLLMERLYQMKVIPDLLSEMHPSIDVRVTANTLGMVPDKAYRVVEPGTFLLPRQTFDPPKIYTNVFHTDTRLYTLVLLDADVPDEANAAYTTYLHWMQPNIPLSANQTSRVLNLNNHTKYIPPHPQQGTNYHRYVLLLLQQPPRGSSKYSLNIEARSKPNEPTSIHLDIPIVSNKERKGFDLRGFMRDWGFDMRQGGGAHMWREVWDEHVSTIYKDILKTPEPRYGRPKKPDPYAALKQTKRYIS
ncbi:PEBP-like protein [Macrolepiota fuliginosa MF-IS2]|uniref:PEBP-like protein n=1 Tax=Macrolepiota fuliginosa MF-IS2 TaxID=1400762 RepID=A0A9P5XD68_9AGAR|nr:PEBP-like protein [Macrolepiota fuliginosa MF-IS2]